MRAVRCDVCGAKAMIAAAKCPSCGHLFELRDGFGELVPLSYCSSCASYYPASVGSCRWCGTKPEHPPISPRIWRGAGAAVVVLVGAVWVFRNGASEDTGRSQSKPVPQAAAAPASADPLSTDTTTARVVVASADVAPAPAPIVDSSSIARDTAVARSVAGAVMPKTVPPPTAPTATIVAPLSTPTKSARDASPPPRKSVRWVRSVSRHWVVIRAGASSDSRIIASIGPNSRVELGESRGSWRRIRAKGLAGWVEPRSSFELVASR